MPRIVMCSRLKREAPGLEDLPFAGPLGQEIYTHVSQEAFDEWKDMQTKIINEYHLDLSESADRQKLLEQMRTFLGLSSGESLKVGTPS